MPIPFTLGQLNSLQRALPFLNTYGVDKSLDDDSSLSGWRVNGTRHTCPFYSERYLHKKEDRTNDSSSIDLQRIVHVDN